MNVALIIPAHNEENRIEKMLSAYCSFFQKKSDHVNVTFFVVLNGCTDNTEFVITRLQKKYPDTIFMFNLKESGKGLAVKYGFLQAIKKNTFDLIGFVDADMATEPLYYYDLINNINGFDGIIASRYMPEAHVYPPRPLIKRLGSKLIFESLIRLLFGMSYYDYQCGAKLFTQRCIKHIAPQLTVTQWAFDVELLYLCKKEHFVIKEIPTTWYDQAGSKLKLSAGFYMLKALFKIRFPSFFYNNNNN